MTRPFVIGIAGGSGSGKSWLAQRILQEFGEDRAALVEQDWYYRDLSHLDPVAAEQTNFDHPDALEMDLLAQQLTQLQAGHPIETPRYAFDRFSRRPTAVHLAPRPLIVVEGLFVIASTDLRPLCDLTVYVDTPADVRLIRRIRRDMAERGYRLEQVLSFWESRVRPMHERFVEPQSAEASAVWKSLEDRAFVPEFLADLHRRLARNAHPS